MTRHLPVRMPVSSLPNRTLPLRGPMMMMSGHRPATVDPHGAGAGPTTRASGGVSPRGISAIAGILRR